ncbi:hypothetical protein B0H16DRAFT_1452768 [Mycena metata]|uniref:Uncharacterized protein n=1 Tax=Mycena metata TaxID=1033252 RepID=A0AAD7JRC7_9AGAR|nr:hypothetical protein B0H16DRAFT_1452768 [Mycena metata]
MIKRQLKQRQNLAFRNEPKRHCHHHRVTVIWSTSYVPLSILFKYTTSAALDTPIKNLLVYDEALVTGPCVHMINRGNRSHSPAYLLPASLTTLFKYRIVAVADELVVGIRRYKRGKQKIDVSLSGRIGRCRARQLVATLQGPDEGSINCVEVDSTRGTARRVNKRVDLRLITADHSHGLRKQFLVGYQLREVVLFVRFGTRNQRRHFFTAGRPDRHEEGNIAACSEQINSNFRRVIRGGDAHKFGDSIFAIFSEFRCGVARASEKFISLGILNGFVQSTDRSVGC